MPSEASHNSITLCELKPESKRLFDGTVAEKGFVSVIRCLQLTGQIYIHIIQTYLTAIVGGFKIPCDEVCKKRRHKRIEWCDFLNDKMIYHGCIKMSTSAPY